LRGCCAGYATGLRNGCGRAAAEARVPQARTGGHKPYDLRGPGVRILLVSYFYPPSIGGVERQSHLLARGLVGRGHSVRVVSSLQAGSRRRELLDGVEIVRVAAGGGSRWQNMATFLAGMLVASARLLGHVDVVQVQQLLYPAAAMALVQPVFRRPLVVRNSGSGQFGGVRLMQRLPLGAFGLRVTARRATGVSLNAEMTREMRSVGFRRIVEIANGVELPPAITPATRSSARRQLGLRGHVVLYVGRLEDEKGVDVLIQAWHDAAIAGATLLVVGDGVRRAELENLAATTGRAGSVFFHGSIADLRAHYAAADLFVLPSRSEGLSNALLEAMAYGLPVIATNVAGNRQVVNTGALGCLVEPESRRSLAVALQRLLGDERARRQYAAAARSHIERVYSATTMVERYEQLYSSLLAGRTHA